ncbi:MAG: hypothetical protein OSB70_03150 [Myxococcota bacterium]|nr:hypothetical protein [Myxococcota bacterium]
MAPTHTDHTEHADHTDSEGLDAESRKLLETLEKLHPLFLAWGDDFQLLGLSHQASRLLEPSRPDGRIASAVDFFHSLATERSPDWVRGQLSAATAPLEDGQGFATTQLQLGSRSDPFPCAYLTLLSRSAGSSRSATFCFFEIEEAPRKNMFGVPDPSPLNSAAFELSPDPIIAVNSKGEIIRLNRAASDLEAMPPERPNSQADPGPESLRGRLSEALETLTPTNDAELPRIRWPRGDGRLAEFSLSTRSLGKVRNDQVSHLVWLRETVPHDKQTEGTLSELDEALHKTDDLIHDLRSPLLALLGFARLLKEDYAQLLDDPGRRFTLRIDEAASEMKEVLEKFEESSS